MTLLELVGVSKLIMTLFCGLAICTHIYGHCLKSCFWPFFFSVNTGYLYLSCCIELLSSTHLFTLSPLSLITHLLLYWHVGGIALWYFFINCVINIRPFCLLSMVNYIHPNDNCCIFYHNHMVFFSVIPPFLVWLVCTYSHLVNFSVVVRNL